MNEDKISELANEYAAVRACIMQGSMTTAIEAENVIRFLLRRFCFVEKERLIRILKLQFEKREESNVGSGVWYYHTGSANTVCILFPEIAKEVEE